MDSENKSQKTVKKLVIAVVLIASVVIVFGVLQLLQRSGKTAVSIQKMPRDMKVYVDNSPARGSTLYLKPGTYKIRGEKNGFESYTREVVVTSNQENPLKVFFVLTPKTDEAFKWVQENTRDYQKIEKLAEEYYNSEGQSEIEKYPIINDLPYRGTLYDIEYYLSGDEFRIQIRSNDALGRQVAIEKIKLLGYEPTDYTVEFLGLKNPFLGVNQ